MVTDTNAPTVIVSDGNGSHAVPSQTVDCTGVRLPDDGGVGGDPGRLVHRGHGRDDVVLERGQGPAEVGLSVRGCDQEHFRNPAHGYGTMKTGVPCGTRSKRRSTSPRRMRMHPWLDR